MEEHAVRTAAEAHGLTVRTCPLPEQPRWSELYELLEDGPGYDVGVAVSFGYLIPGRAIRGFRVGTLNLHPSLLPKYRGAAPIQHALLNGDADTAVSVIELSHGKFDHGQILHQIPVKIAAEEGYASLSSRLATTGAEAIVQTLRDIDGYRSRGVDQTDTGQEPSMASKLEKGMADIDLRCTTRAEVYRLWRAISHQHSLRVGWNDSNTPLHLIELAAESEPTPTFHPQHCTGGHTQRPGTVLYHPPTKRVYAQCADGEWIGVTKLQFPTKKVVSAMSFANGHRVAKLGGSFLSLD